MYRVTITFKGGSQASYLKTMDSGAAALAWGRARFSGVSSVLVETVTVQIHEAKRIVDSQLESSHA